MARLGRGELLAGAGATGLLVTLFLDWFDTAGDPQPPLAEPARVVTFAGETVQRSGWQTVGWLAALLAALAIAATAFWLLALLAPDTPPLPFAPDEVALVLAIAATVALATRLVVQPDLGAGLADAQVEVVPSAFAGVACAALIAAGAWRAISDDVGRPRLRR